MPLNGFRLCALAALAIVGAGGGDLVAQESSDELAKQLANPISSLISVPFQFNGAYGGGVDDDGQWYTLNIQPVIPIAIAPDWNLIVRTIVPVMGREDVSPLDSSEWGFGNTLQSFFFTPSLPGGLIIGAGPAINYPTTTDPLFGPSEWGAGPTAVAALQKGPWTVGVLANQVWSFDHSDDPEGINAAFMQPFVAYAAGNGWTLNANIQASYAWNQEQWTAPLNVGFSKVFHLGTQAMSIGAAGTYYLASPDDGPEWGFQTTLTFLFPTKK
jgi:hypothetical protein